MNTAASFRSRLATGDKLIGTMLTLANPCVAEILADVGFDWLFVDGEHGPLDVPELLAILQAVSDKIPCLVRVPEAAEVPIKRALDLGATGIIVPQVNTAEQARNIVKWARYSPQGERGVGLARAHMYGRKFRDYIESANKNTVVVVQAEHIESVNNLSEIVKVQGVDAVLMGPYDLSASLGKMGQLDDPTVVAAMDRITSVCQAAKMPLGYFGVTAAAVKPMMDKGYSLITAGVDALLLGDAAGQMLKQLR